MRALYLTCPPGTGQKRLREEYLTCLSGPSQKSTRHQGFLLTLKMFFSSSSSVSVTSSRLIVSPDVSEAQLLL